MVVMRRHQNPHPQHHANNDEHDSDHQLSLRAKRNRAATLHDQQELHKRRKLGDNHPQKLRIPVRARAVVPKFEPAPAPELPTPATSIDSPTPKPQYDQFRRVEEKARASIRDHDHEDTKHDERRKLRSEHGGSRSKTELAQYFPNFEEMLSLEPSDPAALTGRTKIILIDNTPNFVPPPGRDDPFGTHKPLHNAQIIDLPSLKAPRRAAALDPLGGDAYLKIHRKAERHEKQMKNGDRERAQHEKYQLERLLDDLRGPDWLKTLGISGITETEKRRYEPKRSLFVRETQALINKFKWWKEEEKRRKVEREQALAEEAAELEAEDVSETGGSSQRSASTQPPNSSELDALASQQLLEEAKSANKRRKTAPPDVVPPPPPVHKPFVSFFAKKHLRDAAVSGRQRGRTVLAFGHPIPDLGEQDFILPEEYRTEDAIKSSQRSRRRRKRDTEI